IRGVIPEIDVISDLNITDEFDHLRLHPDIHHVFFPFDWRKFEPVPKKQDTVKLIIGHAPTNRLAKGSDIIIPIIEKLAQEYPIELLLIEKMSYEQALRQKARCDIFVDQIGDLGYGINSLEALAMEIPVCSCLAPGFAEKYPHHPFIVVDARNLRHKLIELIGDKKKRQKVGIAGRKWVQEHHDARKIVRRIHELAGIA
ncbi:glycosyltransferase, partial [candidate division KSB1 bacterium]|nr:glycosyltransferase [candidate division KSB1 bacterium]